MPRTPQPPMELEGGPESVQAECGCFTTSLDPTGDSAHPARAQRGPAAGHTPDSKSAAEAEPELPSPGSWSKASQKGLRFCSYLLETATPGRRAGVWNRKTGLTRDPVPALDGKA